MSVIWVAAANAGVSVVGTVGSQRFWHDQPVLDVHVEEAGALLTLAGCAVYRWRADGSLVERFSPDAPVTLFGHSWGAMYAALYIQRHPDRVGDYADVGDADLGRVN